MNRHTLPAIHGETSGQKPGFKQVIGQIRETFANVGEYRKSQIAGDVSKIAFFRPVIGIVFVQIRSDPSASVFAWKRVKRGACTPPDRLVQCGSAAQMQLSDVKLISAIICGRATEKHILKMGEDS